MKIYTYGEDILRQTATKVTTIDDDVKELIQSMIRTMLRAPGVGLAAPQVGRSVRLIIVTFGLDEDTPEPRALINPEIISHGTSTSCMEEGCLSVPETNGNVVRWQQIKVRYMDEDQHIHELDVEGMTARIIQHEIDHLDGILYIDRLSPLKRDLMKRKLKKRLRKDKTKE